MLIEFNDDEMIKFLKKLGYKIEEVEISFGKKELVAYKNRSEFLEFTEDLNSFIKILKCRYTKIFEKEFKEKLFSLIEN